MLGCFRQLESLCLLQVMEGQVFQCVCCRLLIQLEKKNQVNFKKVQEKFKEKKMSDVIYEKKKFCIPVTKAEPFEAIQFIVEDFCDKGISFCVDGMDEQWEISVSYTHLTLPTILLVQISVGAVSLKKKTHK
eukprot:TRINITY_DN47121_c0_g1_i1.p2 TRINITY_DN47121_c0_g1~~TRINITY_DN47121_c0_g1_i1.p2  ORF type:complete len:132 (+),score=16.38 TRINITY_DN47121_c0_g1_i1:85-480(+)